MRLHAGIKNLTFYITCAVQSDFLSNIRGSIVVSISACHAEDPGSIPGRGVLVTFLRFS